jgi:hypothetical protein
VGVCWLTAMLVVPREVPPELVPPARIDRAEQAELLAAESSRALRARAGLSLAVRSVGEALRRYGRSVMTQPDLAPQLGRQLRRLVSTALEQDGSEPLLELRALQAELFAAALAGRPETPPPEAIELGGGLLREGGAPVWFVAAPAGADGAELATLYRHYWAAVTGLGRDHRFAPTLNEWRVYYRFLLGRPIPEGATRPGDVKRKLEYVAALAQHDQDYPAHLARGILLYQAGEPAKSALELRSHLEQAPDGPWTLRAQNYLAACGALLIE